MSWTIFVWILGVWALLRVLPLLMAFLALLRVTLQSTAYRRVDTLDVDPELAQFLRTVAARLAPLGFEELGFTRVRRALRTRDDQVDVLELYHAETATFATVGAGESPDRWSASLTLSTECEVPLLTLNGLTYAMVGDYPGVELFDPYAPTLEEAARAHLARLQGARGRPMTPDARLVAGELRDHRYLESLRTLGLARAGREPGTLELTAKGALIGTRKIMSARKQLSKMAAARRAHAAEHPGLYPEPPLSEEVRAYRRHEDVRRTPNRRQTMVVIFGGTAALFALSMLHLFDATGLLVLVAVIFFHELGHYLAMRLFDYRDTTIFFIPFLGAAATGRKDRPSLPEEMIILLAGPMPGLLLGALLALPFSSVPSSQIGRSVILMLVSVNLFNLLPIFPLDGGRIVHALLFAGRPWLDAAFKVLAVASFAALGVFSREPVVVIIALLVAMTIPLGFRTSRMEAEFRAEEAVERPADPVRWIWARLRGDRPAPFAQKLAIVRQLEQRLAHVRTRWWRTVPWLALYGGCVAGGVAAIAMGRFARVFAAPSDRTELACPLEASQVDGAEGARLFCTAPDERTALDLQESLVLAEVGGPYCVPAPWDRTGPVDETLQAARRRALLTLRIAQHWSGPSLRDLLAERIDDQEFDRETVELMIRAQENEDDPEPARALARRLGGDRGRAVSGRACLLGEARWPRGRLHGGGRAARGGPPPLRKRLRSDHLSLIGSRHAPGARAPGSVAHGP